MMERRVITTMSNGNGALSQEEIDRLMNKDNDNIDDSSNAEQFLTAEERDIIGEVGNIAMGSAATVLYTLMNKEVKITTPSVEVKRFNQITEEYTRPCVLVKVEYVSGLEGINLLIINMEDAAVIADLMMGGDGQDVENEELDEIHLSAVGEAMNQMMGSSSTSISNIIDEMVNISPPEPKLLVLDEVLNGENEFFPEDELLVVTSFDLKIGELVDSSFKQLAPLAFSKQLTSNLQQNMAGLTAKSDNTQQNEISAVTEEKLSINEVTEENINTDNITERVNSDTMNPDIQSKKVDKEGTVGVKEAQFPEFDKLGEQPLPQNMELLKDVPLEVTVRLGKARMTINEILDLGEGSIVELDKLAGEPVDLHVNGKLIAKGEVVVIDENFGFRVKDIIKPMDRIVNNI